MQKMADFCGFLVFFMVKTVFLCPAFGYKMQKNGGFLRFSGVFYGGNSIFFALFLTL